MSFILKKHYISLFLILNVNHYDKPLATDTVYSDAPVIDESLTSADFL